VIRPEWVGHILHENAKNYIKSTGIRRLSIFLGEGLFTAHGATWFKNRRLAQPAFHRQKLQSYSPLKKQANLNRFFPALAIC
jgi:cytochrome P450